MCQSQQLIFWNNFQKVIAALQPSWPSWPPSLLGLWRSGLTLFKILQQQKSWKSWTDGIVSCCSHTVSRMSSGTREGTAEQPPLDPLDQTTDVAFTYAQHSPDARCSFRESSKEISPFPLLMTIKERQRG